MGCFLACLCLSSEEGECAKASKDAYGGRFANVGGRWCFVGVITKVDVF